MQQVVFWTWVVKGLGGFLNIIEATIEVAPVPTEQTLRELQGHTHRLNRLKEKCEDSYYRSIGQSRPISGSQDRER